MDQKEVDFSRIAAQTAPILDRLGRSMIDLAPILAQMGTNLQKLFPSKNTSLHTNEGSHFQPQNQFYFQVPLLPNPQELLKLQD
jgi:hypothetical protein